MEYVKFIRMKKFKLPSGLTVLYQKTNSNSVTVNILVKTGKAGKDEECEINPNYTAEDLYDAANYILKTDKEIILKEVEKLDFLFA